MYSNNYLNICASSSTVQNRKSKNWDGVVNLFIQVNQKKSFSFKNWFISFLNFNTEVKKLKRPCEK